MSTPPIETQVASREIFHGSILRIRHDDVVIPNGEHRKREVVEHPGGVVVVATLPNGNLLLIRQYRYALGQHLLEFPAGKREPNEEPQVTIARELEEETGYLADHWEEITYVYTSPGFCNEKIYIYKASGLHLSPNPRRDEDEYIELLEASVEEVRQMIRSQRLVDAKSVCAFGLLYPIS
jgi:ADP-ribose pyrophosphatase